jgi:hypothetical protein
MSKIVDILKKEKAFNDSGDNHEELMELFNSPYYQKTHDWFDRDKNLSLSDRVIGSFSQKKELNEYNISFKINMSIYNGREPIGDSDNNEFKIKSSESLRDLNKRYILNFLIDEENKEIAFLFLDNTNHRAVKGFKYSEIEFIKGTEIIHEKKNKLKM